MLATTKNILKKAGFQPLKRLGQNFLTDKSAVKKIIEAAELKPTDIILEIGPGTGALTQELARRTKKVIAVEKDQNLIRILNNELRTEGTKNIEIVHGDILKIFNSKFIIHNSCKVIGNLPFYLTAPVIRQFLESAEVKPLQMVLVVQKEVGQRICAKPPGAKRTNPLLPPSLPLGKMNLLAVSVQFYAEPKIISYISKKSFWPQPKVDAAIIKIQIPKSKLKNVDRDLFFKIVKAGFSQPRKQLINNLSKKLEMNKKEIEIWLRKNGIQPTRRAETLSINDWLNLVKSVNNARDS